MISNDIIEYSIVILLSPQGNTPSGTPHCFGDTVSTLLIHSERQKDDVVPCSDCAAEVLAVGSSVTGFKPGDRVCANFSPLHIFGDTDLEKRKSGLGALIDGVLTEYRVLPAEVGLKRIVGLPKTDSEAVSCAHSRPPVL